MEGWEEMLKDVSGAELCNLLSTLKSVWDFSGASDKITGHTSTVCKKSSSHTGKMWTTFTRRQMIIHYITQK